MEGPGGKNLSGDAMKGAFVFVLLATFALLSLFIVLIGAKVYRSVEDSSARNNESRTALSYVAGKVRAFDGSGMVSVETVDGSDILVLAATFGGTLYNTYIYYDEGNLCECFARADRGLNRALGDQLVAVNGFFASVDGNLLYVHVTDGAGNGYGLHLLLQSDAEAVGG